MTADAERLKAAMRGKARAVCLALLGAAALVLKRHYAGPGAETVRCYGGNVAASFAAYYVLAQLPFPPGLGRLLSAGLALAAAELFELTNGLGVMANTYDPADYAANAVGVALALLIDLLLEALMARRRAK